MAVQYSFMVKKRLVSHRVVITSYLFILDLFVYLFIYLLICLFFAFEKQIFAQRAIMTASQDACMPIGQKTCCQNSCPGPHNERTWLNIFRTTYTV